MTDETPGKPKIIIDEGWKSTAQQEKQVAQELRGSNEDSDQPDSQPPPPASFSVLVTTLATQIMVSLGQFPSPDEKETKPEPAIARHLIDTLAMLEEKTKGNLTDEETGMLTRVLHELRMLYVATEKALADAPPS
ncbi:MAG: hypothetical protein CMJ59_22890 [Planctomycetaceae bacterium]|nr:hypothetical protein [Planctomycetaceae bacterium]